MEQPVDAEGMETPMGKTEDLAMVTHHMLKPLSLAAMEILLTSLDPRLEGFGEGPSCLDDARAFLARLANSPSQNAQDHVPAESETMQEWIEIWRSAGGNRQTLRLLVQALIAERLRNSADQEEG